MLSAIASSHYFRSSDLLFNLDFADRQTVQYFRLVQYFASAIFFVFVSMSSNTDLRNFQRGKCSCGQCEEFYLPSKDISISNNGWCLYCNHPPVEHELLGKPELNTSPSRAESLGENSTRELQHETQEVYISFSETEIDCPYLTVVEPLAAVVQQKPAQTFPLPEFSAVVHPLLHGDELSERDVGRLSSILKEELISFLNRENLISSGNPATVRWNYHRLGKALAEKYPKMLWDLPSSKQKKITKENANIFSVFIRRLSQRRKMQRLRDRKKEEKEQVDLKEQVVYVSEVSPEDAALEIKSVTLEAARSRCNMDRIMELLKRSFIIRCSDELSELPAFLMAQSYLETEIELRLESSVVAMESKLLAALGKLSAAYSVPGTMTELEKLMQPKRSTWNAITIGEYSPDQKRPGPSIFFGKVKVLLADGDQDVILDETCSLERASILLLGVYFVLNLNFPAAYGQFLGLLQNLLVPQKKFPIQFSSNHLLQVSKKLM